MKTSFLAAVTLLLMVTSACEDPSNVGLGLIGEEGGEPTTRELPPQDLRPEDLARTLGTGRRIVAGVVDDPLLGRVRAESYADFGAATNSTFRSGTVQSAELRLKRAYTFGDTTSAVTIAVRQIQSSWEVSGLPADTTFPVGDVLAQFTVGAQDTGVVIVPLPQDWVEANDAVLRSDQFSGNFHGFRFEPVSGEAVIGFDISASTLRARTQADSASFIPSPIYVAGRRESEPTLPADRLLLQAGAGPGVAFSLQLDPEQISPSAINSATLTFPVDTLALQQNLPTGFVRPTISTLDLFAVRPDGSATFLARAILSDGAFRFNSRTLATELQKMLLGEVVFDRFEMRLPAPPSVPDSQAEARFLTASVNALVFYTSEAGNKSPKGVITITPLDE